MTAHDKFIAERDRIVNALTFSDIPTIQFNKDAIPKQLPCAIVILDSETGKNGTSRQYVSTDLAWSVFLIINAQNQDIDHVRLERYRLCVSQDRTIGIDERIVRGFDLLGNIRFYSLPLRTFSQAD